MVSRWFVLIVLLTGSVYAGSLGDDASAYLTKKRGEAQLIGVTAAIGLNGVVIWEGAAGPANIEDNIAATPQTAHRIASISKAMTATAVMQLVEQGRMNLDAPIQEYVPTFPKKEQGAILIRNLLSHTSGIRHYGPPENHTMIHYDTLLDAVKMFQDDPIGFAPGARYKYTTYGYTLLGAALEKASGQGFREYMREHIWDPAGMTYTDLGILGEVPRDHFELYIRDKDGIVKRDIYDDLSVKYPAGGMISTAGDLVRFAIALDSGKLVRPETLATMRTVPAIEGNRNVDYGYGLIVGEDWNKELGPFYGHDGGQSGTSTNLAVFPEKGIIVAVIANLYNASPHVKKITFELAAMTLHSTAK